MEKPDDETDFSFQPVFLLCLLCIKQGTGVGHSPFSSLYPQLCNKQDWPARDSAQPRTSLHGFQRKLFENRYEVTIRQRKVSARLCVEGPVMSSEVKVPDPLQRGLRGRKEQKTTQVK